MVISGSGNTEPPNEHWMKFPYVRGEQLAFAKLAYVMSKTGDPERMKKLFEANLRGEGEGSVVPEWKIQAKQEEPMPRLDSMRRR